MYQDSNDKKTGLISRENIAGCRLSMVIYNAIVIVIKRCNDRLSWLGWLWGRPHMKLVVTNGSFKFPQANKYFLIPNFC